MDPPIKLFGQTIAVSGTASSPNDVPDGDGTSSTGAWEQMSSSPQDGAESGAKTDLTISNGPVSCFLEHSSSGSTGRAKLTPSPSEGYGLMLSSAEPSRGTTAEDTEDMDADDLGQAEGATSDGGNQHGEAKGPKMPRRPDKAVACPRCHSLETKFCYYNNYNVKQPRHFCKHCQRYWTAGGTLRNVPVGAGRRKNKHGSVVSPRQMTEMMGFVRGDESDAVTPIVVGKGVALPVPVTVPPVPAVLGGTLACSSESVMRAKGGSSDGSGTDAVYSGRGWESKDMPCRAATSAPCGSPLLQDVKGETSGSPEGGPRNGGELPSPPSNGGGEGRGPQGAGAQSNTNGSFGFFNGGWPYAYNVGWNGGAAAAFCGNEVAGLGNALPPPTPANVAAWSGAAAAWNGAGAGNMWTGIPWPVPDLAWSPTGWAPPWHIAPWAMGAVAAGTVVAMSPPVGTGGAVAGAPVPVPCPGATSQPSVDAQAQAQAQPQPQPQPGPRTSESLRPPEAAGAVWAPKSLRMVDRDEAMRSSVWRILGVGSRPDLTAAGTTFKSFQPKPETEKAG